MKVNVYDNFKYISQLVSLSLFALNLQNLRALSDEKVYDLVDMNRIDSKTCNAKQ